METHDNTVLEKEKAKVKPPSLYNVILHNDDYTPMEFVVGMLIYIFNRNNETAVDIMFKVHNDGKAIAGTYTKDIAETKAQTVIQTAEKNGHPLKATVEKE